MIARDLALAEATGAHVHIAHISTAGGSSSSASEGARPPRHRRGYASYLALDARSDHSAPASAPLAYDTNAKMYPPLRAEEDRTACVAALADGTIDCIATDHAPHAIQEKACEFDAAPFGIVGLETSLGPGAGPPPSGGGDPCPHDWAGACAWPRRAGSKTSAPLSAGASGDVAIIDPEAEWTVEPETFASKGKNTPLGGWDASRGGSSQLSTTESWLSMPAKARLILEDGTVFEGTPFGAPARSHGEVVFSTAMTGYQEMLTDPSFAGQVLVLTYPLAGNYGINRETVESKRIQVRGLVVHEACDLPSHWGSDMTLHEYLASQYIPGIAGVDTRALTRRLRTAGVMIGAIASDETADEALARLRSLPRYGESDLVREVSTDKPYEWPSAAERFQRHVVVVDSGVKYNILRLLSQRGCRVTTLPARCICRRRARSEARRHPLFPGPGDPAFLD